MGNRGINLGGNNGPLMPFAVSEAQKKAIETHKNNGVPQQGPAVRYAGGIDDPAAQARADADKQKLLATLKGATSNDQRQDDLVQFAKNQGDATTGMTINQFRQMVSDVLNDPSNGVDAATAADVDSFLQNAIDRTAILIESGSASLDGHASYLRAGKESKLGGSGD